MRVINHVVSALLMGAIVSGCAHRNNELTAEGLSLSEGEILLRHLDYQFAVEPDEQGVPRIDWDKYREREERVVETSVESVVLENRWFRATVLPGMGRLHSFVSIPSGREQLWINPIAVPLGAHNDTGFWMTWGGIEHVMPRGEHGTSHALDWDWKILDLDGDQIGVQMSSTEPLTGLHHTIRYIARRDEPFLETQISISNQGTRSVAFSHWTTATLSPGGRGEVTPETEIIVPADKFVPDDRDFNVWMEGMVGDTRTAPIRFVGQWRDIGDLMASTLHEGYYAVFSHEEGDGLIRTFPLSATPGFDIWGWGYPAGKRQREFTRAYPSHGYIEFWNGNVHGFKDDALAVIAGGGSLSWRERLASIHARGSGDQVRDEIETLAHRLHASSNSF